MRTLVTAALICVAVLGCSRSAPKVDDPQLRKAETVARYLTSARHLNKSMYTVSRSSGTPSELVSYLFSTMGAAEWPPSEEDPVGEQEQARAVRMPVMPKGVGFVALYPEPRIMRQLVLRADDAKRELIAEGYTDPAKPPVFVERWPMPDVKAAGK